MPVRCDDCCCEQHCCGCGTKQTRAGDDHRPLSLSVGTARVASDITPCHARRRAAQDRRSHAVLIRAGQAAGQALRARREPGAGPARRRPSISARPPLVVSYVDVHRNTSPPSDSRPRYRIHGRDQRPEHRWPTRCGKQGRASEQRGEGSEHRLRTPDWSPSTAPRSW